MRASAGDVSGAVEVAAVTSTGPRRANEDRSFTSPIGDDGSWVIAVADGVSGTADPHRASQAATEGLPARIESRGEMRDAFGAAAARVEALTPTWEAVEAAWRAEYDSEEEWLRVRLPPEDPVQRWTRHSEFDRRHGEWRASCPATTLCVAAWTPQGGLLVGSMGDVLAFDIHWRPEGEPFRRMIADPHRDPPLAKGVTSYLRSSLSEAFMRDPHGDQIANSGRYFANVAVPAAGRDAVARAVVVASDGAWEPLDTGLLPLGDLGAEAAPVLYHHHSGIDFSPLARVVAALAPEPRGAAEIASTLLEAADSVGLEDNATVAVAVMSRRGAERPHEGIPRS